MTGRTIIVIGGSAGSGTVLKRLLAALPSDFTASLFVTVHLPSSGTSGICDALAGHAALPVSRAIDGQPIMPGRIYTAPPDHHLLLIHGTILLGGGPRENMARPAIDPMFRSAALAYSGQVVGVVLSGLLNDGAAGLQAIKAQGGMTIVQHPLDAEAGAMPLAALQAVDVDHVGPADQLAGLIVAAAATQAGPPQPPDDRLRLEVDIAAGRRLGSAQLRRVADPSAITCPDCGGVLSEVRGDGPLRFRCQVGHAYTAATLAARLGEVDEAVRVAMRIMEERVTLVERMALDARHSGRSAVADLYDARAEEYRRYAVTLRDAATAMLRDGAGSTENMP